MQSHYDIVIVGAGIAGCALAHSLSLSRPASSPPLRIALLERSLSMPDRIVGELLQPGGMRALATLGLSSCTEGIDEVPVHGYCVLYEGKQVEIPYPKGAEGRSFHHGAFVMNLRAAAKQARGVSLIEATVNEYVECPDTARVLGVRATRKTSEVGAYPECFFAALTIVADGCYSKFRSTTLGSKARAPVTKSHFIGAILKHAPLPLPHHGTVALVPGSGPVLMYQIGNSTSETRMLVDIKAPLPSDIKSYVSTKIVPALPEGLAQSVVDALERDRLRSMPNSFLPARMQGQDDSKEGVILIGDAWNMRHPLTGGGMTVAFTDVVILTRLLTPFLQNVSSEHDASDTESPSIHINWYDMLDVLNSWHWERKGLASTVNILSVALYDLFGADDLDLHILREGCFAYFERGGECINGPVSLLSALAPEPLLLMRHFFAVAFYSIYRLFTTPGLSKGLSSTSSPSSKSVSSAEYPFLVLRSVSVIWTACIVFGPLLWSEIRWW